jgi:tetratricopeptide (TPR) repeat protein
MRRCVNEKIGSLILPYVMGLLSDEECSLFEEHLMDCDFCHRELKKMKPFASVMRQHGPHIVQTLHDDGISFQSLKADLRASYRSKHLVPGAIWQRIIETFDTLLRRRVLVPAVGLAAALGLSLLIIIPSTRRAEAENPFIAYLSFEQLPYQPLELRDRAPTQAERYYSGGMDDYLKNNYAAAARKLHRAVEMQPEEGNWWLRLGVCYFLNRQPKPAIEALTKADELTQRLFNIRVCWYLAQSYLLNGDPDNAIPLLERVVAQDRAYADEAKTLLENVHTIMKAKQEK